MFSIDIGRTSESVKTLLELNKDKLTRRAAVYGAMEYLNSALFGVRRARALSTQDVFQILLRSFHAAHCLILEEEAMLTTLTAAVVLPTCDDSGEPG